MTTYPANVEAFRALGGFLDNSFMSASIATIIPAFNCSQYLSDAIESVLAQTLPSVEVVVVDDGSTDDTAAIAQKYPVRLIRLARNRGHAHARNVGLRGVTAEWVAWLDADDTWDPGHLQAIVSLIAEFPWVPVIASSYRFIGSRTGTVTWNGASNRPTDIFCRAFRGTPVSSSAVATHRPTLLAIGGFPEEYVVAPDYALWLRLAYEHPFVATDRVTASYRWHPAQISSNKYLEQLEAIYRARQAFLQHLGGKNVLADALRRLWKALLVRDLTLCVTGTFAASPFCVFTLGLRHRIVSRLAVLVLAVSHLPRRIRPSVLRRTGLRALVGRYIDAGSQEVDRIRSTGNPAV